MKILILFSLLLSTQVFAHDWKYTVKYPDGKIFSKQLTNTENFMFPVKDYICSVNPLESEDVEEQDHYELNCLSKTGVHSTFRQLETVKISIPDEQGKDIKVEISSFNSIAKK